MNYDISVVINEAEKGDTMHRVPNLPKQLDKRSQVRKKSQIYEGNSYFWVFINRSREQVMAITVVSRPYRDESKQWVIDVKTPKGAEMTVSLAFLGVVPYPDGTWNAVNYLRV